MPDITYLTHTSLTLAVLYGSYWLLLRRETFHQLNRWLLLGTMIAVLALPLLPAPVLFPAVQHSLESGSQIMVTALWQVEALGSGVEQAPIAKGLSGPVEASGAISSWLKAVYLGGLVLCLLRLLIQLLWVLVLLFRAHKKKTEQGWVLNSKSTKVPFSFGPFIVLPETLEEGALRSHILAHERAHCRQWHTLDIMMAELFSAFLWFHPLAWWLKRSLRLQLEHLADAAALKVTADRKAYQYSLLQVAARQPLGGLTNSFNQSIIKTRIVMINAKKSPGHSKLKYFVPFLLAFGLLMAMNPMTAQTTVEQSHQKGISTANVNGHSGTAVGIGKVQAGESSGTAVQSTTRASGLGSTQGSSRFSTGKGESVFVVIGAEFPKERLPELKENLRKEGVLLDVSTIEYNDDNLITNLQLKVKTEDGKMHGSGSSYNNGQPIEEPVIFYVHRNTDDYSFGIFTGKVGDKVPNEVREVLGKMKNGYFVGKVVAKG
jgi:hypothetical protein